MNPQHPHGTPQCGARGCPRDECRQAFRAYNKRARILRQRMTAQQRVDAATAIIRRHLDNGATIAAIATAAGVAETTIRAIHAGSRTNVAWRVFNALRDAKVNPHDNPNELVPAGLTVKRIHSLAALGYTMRRQGHLAGVCVATGWWRQNRTVTVGFATAIRDLYKRIGDTPATETPGYGATQARAWARRQGADVPAAWDDPGTLAWPTGWRDPIDGSKSADETSVLRAIEGDLTVAAALTPDERAEAVRVLNARGWVDGLIARHLGLNPRSVIRIRERKNIPPVPQDKRIERWEAA